MTQEHSPRDGRSVLSREKDDTLRVLPGGQRPPPQGQGGARASGLWEGHPSSAPAGPPAGTGPHGGRTSVGQGGRLAVPAHVIPENHLIFPHFSEAPAILFIKKNLLKRNWGSCCRVRHGFRGGYRGGAVTVRHGKSAQASMFPGSHLLSHPHGVRLQAPSFVHEVLPICYFGGARRYGGPLCPLPRHRLRARAPAMCRPKALPFLVLEWSRLPCS